MSARVIKSKINRKLSTEGKKVEDNVFIICTLCTFMENEISSFFPVPKGLASAIVPLFWRSVFSYFHKSRDCLFIITEPKIA